MVRFLSVAVVLAALVTVECAWSQNPAEDPFALGVRNTEPVSADEQLASFQVPEGFAVSLVAAEPDIAKPMNLAFDARGRLWVSSSLEYPFAAPEGQEPRDTIRILEDTNGDFRADRVTVFADQLNIPIGLIPWGDGVICFSIPNIWFLRDTDGDNRCDRREILYGPFDTTRDTHGMCNAFRRGGDGWIYACHGFNNQSTVAGSDGHKVTLLSGNTFRFRPDGSRIEMYTQGQVNPFGMAIDDFGDIYTADCHTKPVTLLLPGGCYDSFGRPHDGLGYVPNVMEHLHGSTAIAALALGSQTTFPPEYQTSTFDGNVMTSRVNRNQLQRTGASVRAIEQPDLVSSGDPWFRPVDLVAGPDGALYIADFYNRIIGHYEVDLKHPGRDRFRGRIWRVSWKASDAASPQSPDAPGFSGYGRNLTGKTPGELLQIIRSGPPIQKQLAHGALVDSSPPRLREFLLRQLSDPDPVVRRHVLRLLGEQNQADTGILQQAVSDPDETVRVNAFRVARGILEQGGQFPAAMLRQGFADASAMVRRSAAAAAARQTAELSETISGLMRLFHTTDLRDVHLRHTVRISLRDLLRNDDQFRQTASAAVLTMDRKLLADLSLALKTPPAAEFVAGNIQVIGISDPAKLAEYLQFAAAQVSAETADHVVSTIRERFSQDLSLQQQLLRSIRLGFAQRNQAAPATVRDWALAVTLQLLGMKTPEDLDRLRTQPALEWQYEGHPESPNPRNCWGVTQNRQCADGTAGSSLFSSFEAGERRTGIYRSAAFSAGESLSFYLAGHDGFPTEPLKKANFVRLRDAASQEILREASPPRNDVAQKVDWDTREFSGKLVSVELVDGDTATAYAWLAVGRFSDNRLNPSTEETQRQAAAGLIGDFQLHELQPALHTLMKQPGISRILLSSLMGAAVQLRPEPLLGAVALIPTMQGVPQALVDAAVAAVIQHQVAGAGRILEDAFRVASPPDQLRLAEQLASNPAGVQELLRLMESGRASARLLLRPSVNQKILAVATDELKQRAIRLAESLPSEDAAIEQLLSARRTLVAGTAGHADNGRELFRKNCQICHQLSGEGKQVGPNLDGIGNRGIERLLEDILAPSRNVDVAFRSSTVVTTDGKAWSGLLKELPDQQISIVDGQGKETILSAGQIEERQSSTTSPMPANVSEILSEPQFLDLITFLLQQKQVQQKQATATPGQ